MFHPSFSVLFVILTISAILSVSSSTRTDKKSFLFMSQRGMQKLGQSVIGITVPPSTVKDPDSPASSTVLKRPIAGAGYDERFVSTPLDDDNKWTSLSNIDRFLQQKTLLMGLESSSWGTAEKLQRIRSAAFLENLLPKSFSSETISSSNLNAGGLFKEWSM